MHALLAVLFLCVYLFFAYLNRLPPFYGHPNTKVVEIDDLRSSMITVTVHGTAHYPLRISQPRPKTLTRPARTWWLFPLFPPDDTTSRDVRVMVMSTVEPDPILSYEDMTVDGWVRSGDEQVTPELRKAFEDEGYEFADEVVLIERFAD